MLRGIAIYVIENRDGKSEYKRIAQSQQDNQFLRRANDFSTLEETTIQELKSATSNPLEASGLNVVYIKEANEFHYLYKSPTDNFIIAMVSKQYLEEEEFQHLFLNIRYAYLRPASVNYTLDDIVYNPIEYKKKDKFIAIIQEEVDAVKNNMIKNCEKIVNQLESVQDLADKAGILSLHSKSFNHHARDLRRKSCCLIQ